MRAVLATLMVLAPLLLFGQFELQAPGAPITFGTTDSVSVRGPVSGSMGNWRLDWGAWEQLPNILVTKDSLFIGDHAKVQRLYFSVFDTGRVALPGLKVIHPPADTVLMDTVWVLVNERPEELPELAPIKDIHREPLRIGDLLPWIGLVLALLLLFFFLRWWRSRGKVQEKFEEVPKISPWSEAMTALRRLETELETRPHDIRYFYIELSLILRRYLERKYRIPALESTSGEIKYHLRRRAIGDEKFQAGLLGILRRSDMVKYARGSQPREQLVRDLGDTTASIEHLERKEKEEEE